MENIVDDNQIMAIIIALESWTINEIMEILQVTLEDIWEAKIIYNEVKNGR